MKEAERRSTEAIRGRTSQGERNSWTANIKDAFNDDERRESTPKSGPRGDVKTPPHMPVVEETHTKRAKELKVSVIFDVGSDCV